MNLRLLAMSIVAIAAPQPRVSFEAASVKPTKPDDRRRPTLEFLPGGRFRSENMPFIAILATAYNVPWQSIDSLRIKGVPAWVLAEKYDIQATSVQRSPSNSAPVESKNEAIRLMLQSVLADRFKLRMRSEKQEMAVYAVTVAPHGPKLEKSKIDARDCAESAPFGGTGCHQFLGGVGRGIRGAAVDVSDLALYVSNWSDAPVVDQSGVRGLFNIQTEGWSRSADDEPSRPTLFSIFEQLGLKLVRTRAAVEIFVVEHIERPSAN